MLVGARSGTGKTSVGAELLARRLVRVMHIAVSLAAVVSLTSLLTGCTGASNAGGNTQCRDFSTMSAANQGAVVARMLKERDGRNSSTTDVASRRAAIALACAPADRQGTRIEDLAG